MPDQVSLEQERERLLDLFQRIQLAETHIQTLEQKVLPVERRAQLALARLTILELILRTAETLPGTTPLLKVEAVGLRWELQLRARDKSEIQSLSEALAAVVGGAGLTIEWLQPRRYRVRFSQRPESGRALSPPPPHIALPVHEDIRVEIARLKAVANLRRYQALRGEVDVLEGRYSSLRTRHSEPGHGGGQMLVSLARNCLQAAQLRQVQVQLQQPLRRAGVSTVPLSLEARGSWAQQGAAMQCLEDAGAWPGRLVYQVERRGGPVRWQGTVHWLVP